MSILDAIQQNDYREHGHFTVLAPQSKRRYRIRRGWSGNVDRLNDEGKVTDRFCIHPREPVPNCDNMVAQHLMLLTNEQEFLRIANRTPA